MTAYSTSRLRIGWYPARLKRLAKSDNGDSTDRKVVAGRESLASVLNSTFRRNRSPIIAKRGFRSASSGRWCGKFKLVSTLFSATYLGSSHCSNSESHNRFCRPTLQNSNRPYPLNGLFPVENRCRNARRKDDCSPDGVDLPAMDFSHLESFTIPDEFDAPFLGREWIFRNIYDQLIAASGTRSFVIHGSSGSGKSAILRKLVLTSPLYDGNADIAAPLCSRPSSISSKLASSLNFARLESRNYDHLLSSASQVVFFHSCRAESGPSCTIPEFLSHLAFALCRCRHLKAYSDILAANRHLQDMLRPPTNLDQPSSSVFLHAICTPLHSIHPPSSTPLLLIIDGLDEADFNRPENGDSLGDFLMQNMTLLPDWLRFLIGCRDEWRQFERDICVHLDNFDVDDERLRRDGRLYIDYRITMSARLKKQLSYATGVPEGEDPLWHFADHLLRNAQGNMLYLKLILDLIESGRLCLKSANYSLLPLSLSEVYLLMFNLTFGSNRAFKRVSSLFSIILASLRRLDLKSLTEIINAGFIDDYSTVEDVRENLRQLNEFIRQLSDGNFVIFHSSFRDWLISCHDNAASKFPLDIRQGHALWALYLSRRGNLNPEESFELGHHLLKAHIYKHFRSLIEQSLVAKGRDCQIIWIQKSARDLKRVLCSSRNIAYPNTKVTRLLLLSGASSDAFLDDGRPILCAAASSGQVDLCSILLEFDANVDIVDSVNQKTPLIFAAENGHLEVVQLLHQYGASLSLEDCSKKCALVWAVENDHVTVVNFLLECDCSSPSNRLKSIRLALMTAAATGRTKICEYIVNFSPIPIDDTTLKFSLYSACSSGRSKTARFLLEIVPDSSDTNVLICSIVGGCWDLVVASLDKGINVNVRRFDDGWTAIIAAAHHGYISILELLLARGGRDGASVDITDLTGRSALGHASSQDHPQCVRLLLDRGARLDAQDDDGNQALHLAAIRGNKTLISLLLEHGSSTEEKNSHGLRAIDIAIKSSNISALKIFLLNGAKLGGTTWRLARMSPVSGQLLLRKLVDDGDLLLGRGRIKEAAHRFGYALKKCAILAEEGEQLKEGEKALQRLNVQILIGLARTKRRQGQWKDAIQCCTDVLLLRPKVDMQFHAYFLRAKCHFESKNIADSLLDAKKAADLKPNDTDVDNFLRFLTEKPANSLPISIEKKETGNSNCYKSASPANCSSDSGNQADFCGSGLEICTKQSLDETQL